MYTRAHKHANINTQDLITFKNNSVHTWFEVPDAATPEPALLCTDNGLYLL